MFKKIWDAICENWLVITIVVILLPAFVVTLIVILPDPRADMFANDASLEMDVVSYKRLQAKYGEIEVFIIRDNSGSKYILATRSCSSSLSIAKMDDDTKVLPTVPTAEKDSPGDREAK